MKIQGEMTIICKFIFLHISLTSRYTQIGVVSYGNGCGQAAFPGVFSRVTYVIKWIKKTAIGTQDSNCIMKKK